MSGAMNVRWKLRDSVAHQLYVSDTERELVIDSVRVGPPPPTYGIDVFYQSARGYAIDAMEVLRIEAWLGQRSRESRAQLIATAEEKLALAREAMGKMMQSR
jgi:hypothetical protein